MSTSDLDNQVGNLSADPVVNECQKRYNWSYEWESTSRGNFINDYKFAHGDPINGYQWPNAIRKNRDVSNKPCLTMNIVRQHNLQIVNDMKQNKSAIVYKATGNGATAESANVLNSIGRYIQYHSNAQDAYTLAAEHMVDGGIGWWRVVTDYANDKTFDHEIFIRRVIDPLSIYMDPDIQEKDGSDAMWAIVFDLVPKDEFEDAYPKFKDRAGNSPLVVGGGDDFWTLKDHVRVCEYFRKVPEDSELVSFIHPESGVRHSISGDLLHPDIRKAIVDAPTTKIRSVQGWKVEWYLIVGSEICDKTIWPGKYIPLIRCVGEETIIDGVLDRKGHTRALEDAQRMYNMNASAQVEFALLQGKTPWLAAVQAIENYEEYWNTANIDNPSVLPYNAISEDGEAIAPPQRIDPPTFAPAYQAGMETAFNQIMMTSGQFQNTMGQPGNERTGSAIQKRQAQGENATYHFIDNFGVAIRFTGKIILDLIPHVYDTKRIVKMQADDGADIDVEIDPTAREAFFQEMDHTNTVVRRVFNPQLGQYDVQASVGVDFGTKREETVQALTLLLTQAPGLTGIIGDQLLMAMDFPGAEEAAQRLRRMVPQQALGNGPTEQEQQMMEQIQGLQEALQKSLEKQAKQSVELKGKAELRDIEGYDSETKRMAALAKMLPTDPQGLQAIIKQLVQEALHTTLAPVMQANQAEIDEDSVAPQPAPINEAPIPGAQKARDGHWYVLDPTRKGKYLRIAPLAEQGSPQGTST